MSEEDGDAALIQALLDTMQQARADFTLSFRRLSLGETPAWLGGWTELWRQRLALDPQSPDQRLALMRSANPAYIPRNHLAEAMIRAAVEADDFGPFAQMLRVLSKPYEEQPGAEA